MMNVPTILVAEDTDSSYALVNILLRKDYQLIRAINGVEAIRMYSELHPDVILMDIQMPLLNGLDATRQIREVDKNIPIVAITAFAFESDRDAFMAAGGSDYMAKPIDPDELKVMMRRIVNA